jgi:hypothetical protein
MTIDDLGRLLLQEGQAVDTGHWQALKDVPHTKSIELTNAIYQLGIPRDPHNLALAVAPNLQWAEDHFQERVAGEPTNPGEQYKNWPWYDPNWAAQGERNQFSHTYQERFWPRIAGQRSRTHYDNHGIRYRYGDLNDVLFLLAREPYTRQAYLPIWFPEDTGAHHGGRVPCSLGYHFLLRAGKLHINYFIRSCDFLRYFRDDVYMACRLCQWVLATLQDKEEEELGPEEMAEHGGRLWIEGDIGGEGVVPGTLSMFISSLHIFEGDLPKMRRLYG